MDGNSDGSLISSQSEKDAGIIRTEQHAEEERGGDSISTGNIRGSSIAIGKGATAHVTFTEEQAFTVDGLVNPYLGLRSFTVAERDIFAGREYIVQALTKRLGSDDGDRLLFIVGASGSGKSSLVRAGLLPNLAEELQKLGGSVRTTIIDYPGQLLAVTLSQIIQSAQYTDSLSRPVTYLLLIDQFEEIFIHPKPDEAARVLALLAEVILQPSLNMRIIVTMRSEFLPRLVADTRFDSVERNKVVLRGMSVDELSDAIQRPIQVRHPEKRIEPSLLSKLASDATTDIAYLPLLQVTLEDLWRGGQLRFSAYKGLANAIQRRADTVYKFQDHDSFRQIPRSAEEQQIILSLFLDLVRVSPESKQQDASWRWRLTRMDLSRGDSRREQLISDMVSARLLRTDWEIIEDSGRERKVETVDIVHEALLSEWATLKNAINGERELLRRRARLDQAFGEWQYKQREDNYLLSGVQLAEAEALRKQGDSIFQRRGVEEFYVTSLRRRDQEQQREIEQARALAEAQRKRAEVEARGRRTLSIGIALLVVATFVATWFAFNSIQNEARANNNAATAIVEQGRADKNAATAVAEQKRANRGEQITFMQQLLEASGNDSRYSRAAQILFALEAYRRGKTIPEYQLTAENQVRSTLASAGRLLKILAPLHESANITSVAVSFDGKMLAAGLSNGHIVLWQRGDDLQSWSETETLTGHTERVSTLAFASSGDILASGSWDNTVRLWNIVQGREVGISRDSDRNINKILFDPKDFVRLVVASTNGKIYTWDTGRSETKLEEVGGHEENSSVDSLAFSPDGKILASGGSDKIVYFWEFDKDLNKWQRMGTLPVSEKSVSQLAFNSYGNRLAVAEHDRIKLWKISDVKNIKKEDLLGELNSHVGEIHGLEFMGEDYYYNLVSTGDDVQLLVWDAYDTVRQLRERLAGHTAQISSLAFNGNKTFFVTGSFDQQIMIWSAQDPNVMAHLIPEPANNGRVGGISKSQDGKLWMLYKIKDEQEGEDKKIDLYRYFIWETTQAPPDDQKLILKTPAFLDKDVVRTAINGEKRRIALATKDGAIQIFDATGQLVITIPEIPLSPDVSDKTASSLAFSSDGKHLAVGTDDGKITVWNIEAQEPVRLNSLEPGSGTDPQGHTDGVSQLVFSPDDAMLVSGGWDGRVFLWRLDGRQHLQLPLDNNESDISAIAFDITGANVAAAADRRIYIWKTSDGSLVKALPALHTGTVESLAFSPNETTLVSGGGDYQIRFWDIETGRSSRPFISFCDNFRDLAFISDQSLLARYNCNPPIQWDFSPNQVEQQVCRIVNRNLTWDEWRSIFPGAPQKYPRTCPNLPVSSSVPSDQIAASP